MSHFRKSINFRMTLTVCMIVTLSLLVSGGVAYSYNLSVMKNQCVTNTTSDLEKTARQLEFFINDITKLGDNIAVNEDVQAYLKRDEVVDYYTKYSAGNKVKKKLAMMDVQRDYMYNSVLIKKDEIIISSQQKEYLTLDPASFKELMKQPWYRGHLLKKEKRGFSTPYQIFSSSTVVIPYIINIMNILSPSETIGTLILNIDDKYLKKVLDKSSTGFENYYLLDKEGNFLYNKEQMTLGNAEVADQAVELAGEMAVGTAKAYETKDGYIFINKTLKPGWTLTAYVSKQSIYAPTKNLIFFFIIYTLLIVLCSIAIIFKLISSITRPLVKLTKTMKQVAAGTLDVTIPVTTGDEVGELAKGFNNMLIQLTGYIDSTVEYEKQKRKIEMSLLLAQINPHFIYNTLNTIIYMAQKIKAQNIIDMVRSFIVILQDVVKINKEGLFTTLEEEINIARQYLNIQKYRYKDRFEVSFELDAAVIDCSVPRTIIQPIVENCLLHGILAENRKGMILIAARKDEDSIVIEITDNGKGFEKGTFDKMLKEEEYQKTPGKMRSIGIRNVQERIAHLCGEQYGLTLESKEGEYTTIYIHLPQTNVINEHAANHEN